jgi:class I fructose-bisphosphate aldolase
VSALGKATRLARIFSHPSGRILSVAIDHLINYPEGIPPGLRTLGHSIDQIIAGEPNSITLNKGAAMRFLPRHAGRVPFILQSMALRPDAPRFGSQTSVEEAVALGADAIAVAMFVKGPTEIDYVRHLGEVVRESERFGLPVIPHIYPLSSGDEKTTAVHDPESIFYAVRIALEMGADVIKVPYTGDVASFRDIVSLTPVPVVTAGGPKCATLEEAEQMMRDVARSGAQGSTIGRNIWGFPDIPGAVRRLKAALHTE